MDSKYCESVYSWFDKCGIISNIRTHLRKNLVQALKSKDLSLKDLSNRKKPAKQYVYDFLIAEYLFNVNYAYSLSVFASEAPLLIQFDNYVPDCCGDRSEKSKQKLQSDYIWHTLETLGMKSNDPEAQYIVSEYMKSDEPLLICILKCVALCSFDTSRISNYYKRSVRVKCTQTDFPEQRCISEFEKLAAVRKKILEQKNQFDAKLKERETKLKRQTILMEEQFVSLTQKLEQVQHLLHLVTLKEQQLNERKQKEDQQFLQKEMELNLKENALLLKNERFQRKHDVHKNIEHDLEKLQEDITIMKKEICFSHKMKDAEMQTGSYNNLEYDKAVNSEKSKEQINREKETELIELLKNQQSKIEKLTQYAGQLSHRMEEMYQLKPTKVDVATVSAQVINTNTVISESSSTEDILQDAKLRLKRLEEESLNADRFYYNCIAT